MNKYDSYGSPVMSLMTQEEVDALRYIENLVAADDIRKRQREIEAAHQYSLELANRRIIWDAHNRQIPEQLPKEIAPFMQPRPLDDELGSLYRMDVILIVPKCTKIKIFASYDGSSWRLVSGGNFDVFYMKTTSIRDSLGYLSLHSAFTRPEPATLEAALIAAYRAYSDHEKQRAAADKHNLGLTQERLGGTSLWNKLRGR